MGGRGTGDDGSGGGDVVIRTALDVEVLLRGKAYRHHTNDTGIGLDAASYQDSERGAARPACKHDGSLRWQSQLRASGIDDLLVALCEWCHVERPGPFVLDPHELL